MLCSCFMWLSSSQVGADVVCIMQEIRAETVLVGTEIFEEITDIPQDGIAERTVEQIADVSFQVVKEILLGIVDFLQQRVF